MLRTDRLLQEALHSFVEHVARGFPGGRACTLRLRQGQTLRLVAAHGIPTEGRESDIDIHGTIAGAAVESGSPVLTTIADDARYWNKSLAASQEWLSLLAVPLRVEETIYGVVQIYSRESVHALTKQDIGVIERQTAIAARAIAHAIGQQTHIRQQEGLLELLERLTGASDSHAGYRILVSALAELLQEPACILYRVDGRRLELVAGYPDENGRHGIGKRCLVADLPVALETIQSGQPVIVESAQDDPRTRTLLHHHARWGVVSLGCFPIIDRVNGSHETVGLLVVDHTTERLFRAQERVFLERATRAVAGALHLLAERDELRRGAAAQSPAVPPTARILSYNVIDS